MVDIIRAIRNILDVHGAWVFGGTLAAGLIAHKSRKQKSLDAEWDYVQCIGCGRGGYSDEMRSGQDASGKEHYSCARCSRPDLFKQAEGDSDLPAIGSRWRKRQWMAGPYDWEKHSYGSGRYAPNRMTNSVLEIFAYHPVDDSIVLGHWVKLGGRDKRSYRIGDTREITLDDLRRIYVEEPDSVGMDAEGDSDLKRCHVCGDLTKTETVELEVCERHTTSDFGYNYPDHEMGAEESFEDFRRRMVGDAAIAGDMGYMEALEEYYQDYLEEFEKMRDELCPDPKTFEQFQEMVLKDDFAFKAEDYGVGAVWMADSYDPSIHGNTIPTGSVKRFLEKIPVGQMFHVDFVKSNGDIREMDAFFNKPYSPDSITANVMERTATGAVFKRFRVDRVVGLYRV